ncbi:MAG: glutamate--tRNA ligase [Rickettsiales bacterium]|nr:glutamate--tRNA ligase [Rickettsiales bacterium]
MRQELVDRLIPDKTPTIEEIEVKYPARPEGTVVTRIAPSPTGFMHIGTVWTAMTDERIAHQSNGVFILRIEDTDQKREVSGAVEAILKSLNYMGLYNDEGLRIDGKEYGNYGPYTQSQRKDVYQAYVKELLKKDLAYPSFMSHDELDKIREEQTKLKIRTGLYGLWAKERNLTEQQITDNLDAGKPYVIYFKSNGNSNNKITFEDAIKGKRILPENDLDIVIMKSDGLPTYHFAHLIDDHFMGTTHVVRTDEWFISTPLHIQLFEAMNWKAPIYIQPAPIQKLDNGAKRKLSKRKDPEANFQFFIEKGYPKEVILDYLMNLLNSNYEDWKKENPKTNWKEFPFEIKKLGVSGALFDFKKLDNICKEFMASITAKELYERLLVWAKGFDKTLSEKMEKQKDYFISIFEIERKNCDRVRKDYCTLSSIYDEISYFFEFKYTEETFKMDMPDIDLIEVEKIVNEYILNYDKLMLNHDDWFNQIKEMAKKYNYCIDNKEFNAEIHKGKISDFVAIFRYLITSKKNSPDLYSVMKVLGKEEAVRRLEVIK